MPKMPKLPKMPKIVVSLRSILLYTRVMFNLYEIRKEE